MNCRNNTIFLFVLAFFLLPLSFCYSQSDKDVSFSATPPKSDPSKTKEAVPVFILQGGIKLKGRPVSGAMLTLTKDGKTIAKMFTPKNGFYYFQMNRSMTDPQSEYILSIVKDGVASGVIRVNTYTPKEKFTAVPYMFNLDIALTPPVNAGAVSKKDFGRIKWLTERNVFDFDKGYIPVIEKDTKAADSIKYAEKIKEEAELKRQSDSIAEAWVVASEAEAAQKKAAKAAAEKAEEELKNKNNTKSINTTTAKISKTKNTTNIADLGNDKLKGQIAKTNTSNNSENAKNLQSNKTDPGRKNNIEKNNQSQSNTSEPENASNPGLSKNGMAQADSIRDARNPKKDLFFLTGVPMEQFKRNLPAGETYSRNSEGYNAEDEFITNSERNRLLAAKQRYERKKAENFAKKQETNNTLTSLIDAVEEYGKTKKEMKR